MATAKSRAESRESRAGDGGKLSAGGAGSRDGSRELAGGGELRASGAKLRVESPQSRAEETEAGKSETGKTKAAETGAKTTVVVREIVNVPVALPPSVDWLCGLLQASDTFYPTGSYAHSFGLEGLIAEGVVKDRETLKAFLVASVVPALRQMELPLVAQAWTAFGGAEPDWARIGELSTLSSASKSALEARQAADNIGRQRAELSARLRAHPVAVEYLKRAEAGRWPFSPTVSAALEARVLGAPVEAALAAVFYAAISGLLAAAMKLLRIGQNGCQTLLTEMLGLAGPTVAAARAVTFEEIGWFNPWLDIAAARHERAEARLFIS